MKNKDYIRIIIGGDTCPIGKNESLCIDAKSENVFNDVLPLLDNADIVVLNLECPLISTPSPIAKGGPAVGASKSTINVFNKLSVVALSLANNHIMDHGANGLTSTIEACNAAHIITFGAGINLSEAEKVKVIECDGIRIGLLGIAESEYSIADKDLPGAASINPVRIKRQIDSSRNNWDYLIVLLHGGNEYYRYPSPRLRELCHFIIELGACCVCCQHTHITGCMEKYLNSFIIYGQGNFIFDYPSTKSSFAEGIIADIKITKNSGISLELIPVCQKVDGVGVSLMTGSGKQVFMDGISERSQNINDDFIYTKWLEFCYSKKNLYLSIVLGHNRLLTFLNYFGGFVAKFYRKSALRNMGNIVRCESHREILLTIIKHFMTK